MLKKAFWAILVAVPMVWQLTACSVAGSSEGGAAVSKVGQPSKIENGLWQHDLQDALTVAARQKKLVFVDVSAPWCGACQMLEERIYPNPVVRKFLSAGFVTVMLQAESLEGQSLMSQYNTSGIPALFVMDAQGRVLGKVSGAPRDANSFIELVSELAHGQTL
jgi:thiol:disulfide interchange protein